MSRSAPTFSVVIPTYGRSRYLRDAVASVSRQTVSDLECLVVDDAGPTPVVLEGDPRVRVIRRSTNGGPAAARNTGLTEARGRYIAFLDDDDLFLPERLALAAEGLLHAPIAVCWSQIMGAERAGGRMLMGNVRDSILDTTTPHLGATAVRGDLVQPFDERFIATQDVEWWLRMSERASVWTVPTVGLLYRRHPAARHRNGASARVEASLSLLELQQEYFAAHPRAAAFRWMRIGLMARETGDLALSRRALLRSFRLHPSARPLRHLMGAPVSPPTGVEGSSSATASR